jgi:hypothetical protein
MAGKKNPTKPRSARSSQKSEMAFISSMLRQLAPLLPAGATGDLLVSQHATHGSTRIMMDVTIILLIAGIWNLLRTPRRPRHHGSASAVGT